MAIDGTGQTPGMDPSKHISASESVEKAEVTSVASQNEATLALIGEALSENSEGVTTANPEDIKKNLEEMNNGEVKNYTKLSGEVSSGKMNNASAFVSDRAEVHEATRGDVAEARHKLAGLSYLSI